MWDWNRLLLTIVGVSFALILLQYITEPTSLGVDPLSYQGRKEISKNDVLVAWTSALVELQQDMTELQSDVGKQPNQMCSFHTCWKYPNCANVPKPSDVSFNHETKSWEVSNTPPIKVYLYPFATDPITKRMVPYSQWFKDMFKGIWLMSKKGSVEIVNDPSQACVLIPALDSLWEFDQATSYLADLKTSTSWGEGDNHIIFTAHDNVKLEVGNAWLIRATAATPYMAARIPFDMIMPVPLDFTNQIKHGLPNRNMFTPANCHIHPVARCDGFTPILAVFNSNHFPHRDVLGEWRLEVPIKLRQLEAQHPSQIFDVSVCELQTDASLSQQLQQLCFLLNHGRKVASFVLLHGTPGFDFKNRKQHASFPSFVESLSVSMIPVFINDYYPDPMEYIMFHQKYMIHVAANAMPHLFSVLQRHQSKTSRMAQMQKNGLKIAAMLKTPAAYIQTVLDTARQRTMLYGFRIDLVGKHEIWDHMWD